MFGNMRTILINKTAGPIILPIFGNWLIGMLLLRDFNQFIKDLLPPLEPTWAVFLYLPV
jgi:hypothetical protein